MIKISLGNSKLGKIPNINLPPGKSCPKNVPCLNNGCYALKAYRMYKNVRLAWDNNYNLFTTSPRQYFLDINSWFEKQKVKPKYFRWHSSGDFINQEYIDGVFEICKKYENTTNFLAFTKQFTLDFSNVPNNLNVVYSMWPGSLSVETDKVRSWIDDGIDTRFKLLDNKFVCPGSCITCKMCWTDKYKNIIFIKH